MRFVYLGPPDEPEIAGTFHAMTGEGVTGEPRDVDGASAIAWLSRHPHWAAMEGEAYVDPPGDAEAPPEAPKRGPGRPRKGA